MKKTLVSDSDPEKSHSKLTYPFPRHPQVGYVSFLGGDASKDGDGKFLACNKPDIYIHLQFEEKSYILDQMDTLPPPGGVVVFLYNQGSSRFQSSGQLMSLELFSL